MEAPTGLRSSAARGDGRCPDAERGNVVLERMDLWDMPVIFLMLVGLVCTEWAYRKQRGLV